MESFLAYQQQCQKMMHTKLLPRFLNENATRILELNMPFDWQPTTPTKIGILMIHGMFGSAFSMRDLGQRLMHSGFHVRSLLLPGHCAEPKALCQTDLGDYQQAVNNHIELFKSEAQIDTLYLIGFSFGGLLSLDYVNSHSKANIAGLILLSPALALQSPFASLLPLADRIKPFKWYTKREETDFTRYQSCSVHAAQQVNQLIKDQVPYPEMHLPRVFLSISIDDEVVCPKAVIDFFNAIHLNNPMQKELLLYGAGEAYERENVSYRHSAFAEDAMVNASHISLIFSPENTHYGKNGTANNFLYKLPPSKKKKTVYGAVTKQNLKQYNIYRASYNPEFEYFAERMVRFIQPKFGS